MLIRFILTFILFLQFNLFSQSSFYDIDTVREIRINFYDLNWDSILDSFYIAGNNDRILADLVIDGNQYDSVGVRYKGYSSASVDRLKNPFNIKLDYIIEDQSHEGIKKIKLANGYQDPSFIREVLSYEISRKYLPSSQANFSNLYINDSLWGLYTNVESVNSPFLIKHFESKYNSFFKCNPENINIQIGGENSNLSQSHGLDSLNYIPFYSLKSDYGWSNLYNLIDTLNNFSDSINYILNVDRALWMHAINYSLINFDSYVGYSQNYYLYKSVSNQFNPIIWDLNMSFGSFRLTDASQLFFNGFDIIQAQEMDPLMHYNMVSVSPRPLMRKLFLSERNRKMYLAHIRTIMEENFVNQDYYSRGQYLQTLIDQDVQNDTNKFYTYQDFLSNLSNQVSLSTTICPGISELMDARSNYLANYEGYQGYPVISNILVPQNNNLGDDLWLSVHVNDANYVCVYYRFGANQIFKNIELYDDGLHNDGLAGDGVFGGKISNCSNSLDYYFYAENDSAGSFSPERAAYEFYTARFSILPSDIVINELMSNNVSVINDNSGFFEDWIELYNTTNFHISINGLFLTDTVSNLLKWQLPNHVIAPNSYFTIWADEDGHQGFKHANFKLSNMGETVILSQYDSTIVDSITYQSQIDNISFGRSPNGFGSFNMLTPTYNSNNDFPNPINEITQNVLVFPNPFNEFIYLQEKCDIQVRDILGKIIYSDSVKQLKTSDWNSGIYFVHLLKQNQTIKVIKL